METLVRGDSFDFSYYGWFQVNENGAGMIFIIVFEFFFFFSKYLIVNMTSYYKNLLYHSLNLLYFICLFNCM
jgi:hypothetical protein